MDKEGLRTVSDVLQKAVIALDSYDDIFSDFDPSPYEKRLLSADFLRELRRRHAATPKSQFEISFTLPKALRSEKTESLIRKRIKDHFKSELKETDRKAREHVRTGGIRLAVGIFLTLLIFFVPQLDIVPYVTILSVLIWYTIWSGIENMSEASVHIWKRKAFAEKFHKAEYNFLAQEDVVASLQRLAQAEPSPKEA